MEKRIRRIIGRAKYGDETWEEVMTEINRTVGMDLKTVFQLIGVILDELDRTTVPVVPIVFADDPAPEKENVKKETKSKK